ncbi:hypothetical protein [Noviherbaspirillum massiliense]|uniref:hypothetical protein n=1 Tax=Noviherbaspirillum massiliense TaxID=1465823 RepID=UPI0011DCE7A0|nr:hypothetical protein [Noviherbaspirillum massiliense]
MLKRTLLLIFIAFELNACIIKPLQPTPATFTLWKKKDGSIGEVKSSLLACGFNSPYTTFGMTENAYAEAELCMLDRGFVNTSRDGILCNQIEYKKRLPACQVREEAQRK